MLPALVMIALPAVAALPPNAPVKAAAGLAVVQCLLAAAIAAEVAPMTLVVEVPPVAALMPVG